MSKRWRAAATPATVIVIVTGGFHLYRGAPLDGVVFLLVGAALVADGLWSSPSSRSSNATLASSPATFPTMQAPAETTSDRRARVGTGPRAHTGWAGLSAWIRVGAPIAAALIAGAIAGVAARYSVADVVIVLVVGLPILLGSWARRRRPFAPVSGPPVVRAGWAWACVGLAVALWELSAYLLENSPAGNYVHPSISDLLDPILDIAPARAVFVVCWVIAGVALLRWRRSP